MGRVGDDDAGFGDGLARGAAQYLKLPAADMPLELGRSFAFLMLVLHFLLGHAQPLGALHDLGRHIDARDQEQAARHDQAGEDEDIADVGDGRRDAGLAQAGNFAQPVPDEPDADAA